LGKECSVVNKGLLENCSVARIAVAVASMNIHRNILSQDEASLKQLERRSISSEATTSAGWSEAQRRRYARNVLLNKVGRSRGFDIPAQYDAQLPPLEIDDIADEMGM
jgi:hypothetical protein